jgi:choline trimethylamine-lyase
MEVNKMSYAYGTEQKDIERSNWHDGCSERINRLRDQYWKNRPEIDIERALSYTRTYKKTEAEDTIIRRAKSMYASITEKTIEIGPDELIIGTYGKKQRAAVVCPDICLQWVKDELDTMATRPQDPYFISEEDKKILKEEVFPYWEGRAMEDYFLANMSDELKNVSYGTNVIFGDLKSQTGAGEFAAGYHNIILKKGFKGIQEEARENLKKLKTSDIKNYDKAKFYEAVVICCDSAKLLSKRYADKARELAFKETDKGRKKELLMVADVCENVPYNPPRTFQEAIQSVWFTEILLHTEENTASFCIDRPDQYLYPFYKKEKEAGTLTDLKAQEMLECLWIKMAEIIFVISAGSAMFFAGYNSFHGLTLGGLKSDGSDAINELSYMMLEATMHLRMHLPTINVRISGKTPDRFLEKIFDLVKLGTGQPAIFFDETAIPLLQRRGVSLEDARNWCVGGCVEPQVPGKMNMWVEGCRYSYATAVEWALSNGFSKVWNRQMGLTTGDPRGFKNFAEFKEAVKKQLAYLVEMAVRCAQLSEKAHQMRLPKPLRSCCVEGCLETGVDSIFGGAIYNNGPGLETTGISDLADSLEAVKKLVFGENKLSMDDLLTALENDFEGYEDIRQMLVNGAPKYGNDDDEVDLIFKEFAEYACDVAERFTGINGSCFCTGIVPVISNLPHGQAIWALPSGRKARTPLSDGLSPYPGYDTKGPTSVLKSVCKLDHTKHGSGTLLNMKFSPDLLKNERDRQNFISLLRSEQELGGYHIQFNVVNTETLRAAQKTPEKYPDLLVRVAGYSAFFVDLHKDAQETIIMRTENKSW